MKSLEEKFYIVNKEILIYPFALIVFPLKTIRALVWQWYFWLQKIDNKIKDDHED